jgi:hypothetical protein
VLTFLAFLVIAAPLVPFAHAQPTVVATLGVGAQPFGVAYGSAPVFPYQLVIAASFTLLLAASYLLIRRRTGQRGFVGQNALSASQLRFSRCRKRKGNSKMLSNSQTECILG